MGSFFFALAPACFVGGRIGTQKAIVVKRYPNYRIPIGYMLLYTPLILLSGVWLFMLSQGLDISYGLGVALEKLIDAPAPKSWQNLLEVATPHLFAMGTLIFIVAHFLLFGQRISHHLSGWISMAVMAAGLLDIGVYGMIIAGMVGGAVVKLAAMALFVTLFFLLLGMVFVSL